MTLLKSTGAVMTVISLSLVTTLFAATMIEAQSQLGSPASKTVIGEVSAVEGEFHMAKNARGEDILKMVDKSYVITTPTGRKLELKLSRDTKVPTRANPGDRIEAKISDTGQTLSSCWSSKAVWLLQHRPVMQASSTILIIDNHDDDRQYWAQRLRSSLPDYVVLEASTGKAGLVICRSQRIECVISELTLPTYQVSKYSCSWFPNPAIQR